MKCDPVVLRCLACEGSEPSLELRQGRLVCGRCTADYPVLRGIPVMLPRSEDRESSVVAERKLGEVVAEPFTPSVSTTSLSRRARAELARRALSEIEQAGMTLVRSLVGRHRPKHQRLVKEKYERPTINYFTASADRTQYLVDGRLVQGTGFSYRQGLVAEVLRAASTTGAQRLLEVGFGDGMNFWALDYFHSGHGKELIGFDYSYRRSLLASRYVDDAHHIFNGDAKRIALADGAVDLAFTAHCLEHMPYDNLAAIREMSRVARYVLLIEPFIEFQNMFGRVHNWRADYAKDIRRNVENAGLKIVDWRKLGLGSPFNQSGLLLARAPSRDVK